METDDIRRMIREALYRQIDSACKSLSGPPEDFSSFKMIVMKNLERSGATKVLCNEVFDSSEIDRNYHDVIWEAWSHISQELTLASSYTEKSELWQELKEYYVSEVTRIILSDYSKRQRIDCLNYQR